MTQAKILVVDDEPQIRRTLRATLVPQGYMVVDAQSGEEALEVLRREKPDLVLLDLNMPGMGGLETCRAMRENSEVAIVVLTVRDAEKDKVQVLDAGAVDYVTKPFGMPELLARIRAALRLLPMSPDMPQRLQLPRISHPVSANQHHPATGIPIRRVAGAGRGILQEWRSAARCGRPDTNAAPPDLRGNGQVRLIGSPVIPASFNIHARGSVVHGQAGRLVVYASKLHADGHRIAALARSG